MKSQHGVLFALICFLAAGIGGRASAQSPPPPPLQRVLTAAGVSSKPSLFPIAVWLQDPGNAARYKAAGFNLYIGLWEGPTEAQLAALKAAGMPVICERNPVGLAHLQDPLIAGWMHQDEPDNAQPVTDPKTGKQGYGPCVPPGQIVTNAVPIDTIVKRVGKTTYIFAVGMRNAPTQGTFRLPNLSRKATVEVLGENRDVPHQGDQFTDSFQPYDVHLYRIR